MIEQNETPKNIFQKPWFWMVNILILAGVGAGFYFYYSFVPCATPECYEDSVGVIPEEVPAGVEVVDLENGNRLVKNIEDGYQIEVGSDKYLYSDRNGEGKLVIQDYAEPSEPYGGTIGCQAFANAEKGSLDDAISEMNSMCEDLKPDCINYNKDLVKIHGIDWTKITFSGEFIGVGWPKYYTSRSGELYAITFTCSDQYFIDNILNNYSF